MNSCTHLPMDAEPWYPRLPILIDGGSVQSIGEIQFHPYTLHSLKAIANSKISQGKIVIENHYRWSKGIPQFNLDHTELLNAIEEFENNNSKFYLIGNYFNGVSVSDCIQKSRDLVNIIN